MTLWTLIKVEVVEGGATKLRPTKVWLHREEAILAAEEDSAIAGSGTNLPWKMDGDDGSIRAPTDAGFYEVFPLPLGGVESGG